ALWGAHLRVREGRRSAMTVEVAGSRERDAVNVLSSDGGLTFADADRAADGTLSGQSGDDRDRLAWRFTQDLYFDDFMPDSERAAGTRMRLYAQQVGRGFSAGGGLFERGRFKLGAQLSHRLTERDSLTVRHDSDIAELVQVGPSAADIAANPQPEDSAERAWHRTAVQWSLDRGRFAHRFELGHWYTGSDSELANGDPTVDSHRLGAGAGTTYAASERLRLRVGQRISAALGPADPVLSPLDGDIDALAGSRRDDRPLAGLTTQVGADWRLSDDTAVAADWYQRWNGDSAGQLGLRSALSDSGSVYLRERVHAGERGLTTATVVGAEDRIPGSAGGRTYGEIQAQHGGYGPRGRAVLGLGHRWALGPGVAVSAGFEHQQIFAGFLSDGTRVGDGQRDVIHTGLRYGRPGPLSGYARLEVRRDSSDLASGDPALVDTRPGEEPDGFPDHGGVAPGAPVVLPAGEHWQVTGALGAEWRPAGAHSLFARLLASRTRGQVDGVSFTEAAHVRASAGWVLRPMAYRWLDILARYSYVRSLRPPPGLLVPEA
ncbi:MAG: hypothetical protein AAGC55_24335, partial [Myxococcota bacterium]